MFYLQAFDIFELARIADKYCGGEIRLTVEQNVILPNVKNEDIDALLADPFISDGRFKINPGKLITPHLNPLLLPSTF